MNCKHPILLVSSLAALLLPAALVLSSLPEAAPADSPVIAEAAAVSDTAACAHARRDAARGPGYTAPAGTRLHYDLHVALGLDLAGTAREGSPAQLQSCAFSADGSLHLDVLGRRGTEVLVGYRTTGVRLSVRGEVPAATVAWSRSLERALQQGFDVRMDANARPVAVRFLGEWTGEQRNFARALVNAFRFENAGGASWSSTFDDAMGKHGFDWLGRPEGDDLVLRRTRTAFVPLGATDAAEARVQLRGMADARFAAAVEWLSSATIDEALAWSWIDGALRVSSFVAGRLQWTHSDTVAVQADWDHGFAAMSAREGGQAGDPMRHFWDERLRGLDVSTLLQRLHALLARQQEPDQEYHELLQMLAELVRRDPDEADRLAALVQSARITGREAADLLAVLGMAGHDGAQTALTAVFENGQVDPALRRAAVESMFQVERPRQQLIDSLRRSLYGTGRLDPLAGSAMLALGAFGSRGATGSEGRTLVDELLALEPYAQRDGLGGAWSEALGNSGDPAVVQVAQRLLQAAEPGERSRALTILRRVDSPQAESLLRSAATSDPDADVRREAIQVIGESAAAWTRDVLIARVAVDADKEVRRAACSALGVRARTDPVARAALQQRLCAERDPELLQVLHSLLGA